ncbi:MAG: 1-deoxy-D-xylulose-5-phosphate synthase [Clostridia bacterium]|nr:1-deoxy-D-xylulose-5-phosphate synthase [Clostridia bacterium]
MFSKQQYPHLSLPDISSKMRSYNVSELKALCGEIRNFLINSLSKTGGHLASNLGAVELSVALEYCFDTSRDKLVFDVGHQCYTHKLLTGRAEGFSSLRQKGGIEGFPKPDESSTDPFISGHGSTSVSVAVGLARAHTLSNGDPSRRFIAFIGDGALSGGMVTEALNDAGASKLPVVIVLNDNGMAIGNTVGSFSSVLSKMRVNKEYLNAKSTYHSVMRAFPGGRTLDRTFARIKNSIKYTIIPSAFFECLGFKYVGPVDGHDIEGLIRIFDEVKEYRGPVVIHAVTQKGKGWAPSMRDPEKFHAVSAFDPITGEIKPSSGVSLSTVFGNKLCELAKKDTKIAAITAAMQKGAGLDCFAQKYPKRYFDVGIAEEHAVTMSAGLSAGGIRPFCAIYSTFIQRSFDQIMHDVGIMKLPVVFCIDRAGFVAGDGETHQGLYDVGMLSLVPDMKIYMPANASELETCIELAHKDTSSPISIRYPRGNGAAFGENTAMEEVSVLREGKHITLVTAGRLIDNVLAAADILAQKGIDAKVLKLCRILPLPHEKIAELTNGDILVCEELSPSGSFGTNLAGLLPEKKVYSQNAKSRYYSANTVDGLMAEAGLDPQGIADRAQELCRGN